jgi:hypothetical protein
VIDWQCGVRVALFYAATQHVVLLLFASTWCCGGMGSRSVLLRTNYLAVYFML